MNTDEMLEGNLTISVDINNKITVMAGGMPAENILAKGSVIIYAVMKSIKLIGDGGGATPESTLKVTQGAIDAAWALLEANLPLGENGEEIVRIARRDLPDGVN